MRRRINASIRRAAAGVAIVLAAGAGAVRGDEAAARAQLWDKVEQALREETPESALRPLPALIENAIRNRAYAEAAWAIGRQVALEGQTGKRSREDNIARLDEIARSAPPDLQPLLQAIQAHWLWDYFDLNRWRIMERRRRAGAEAEDISRWDLARMFGELDRLFAASLAEPERLGKIPVSEFELLLLDSEIPDRYRPTLFDTVATAALAFYGAGEQAPLWPHDLFVPYADGPIFAERETFLNWTPETRDREEPVFRGVALLQNLLRFHQIADNSDAMADWDLERLRFGFNHAAGAQKDARYEAALRRFIETHGDREISARARYDLASLLQNSGRRAEAREVAAEGHRLFPQSAGGKLCRHTVRIIEEPSAMIAADRVWSRTGATIQIGYRNATHAYFRLVAWDWDARLRQHPYKHPEVFSIWDNISKLADQILAEKPIRAWSASLPPSDNYAEQSVALPAPENIPAGFYWLMAAHEPTFADRNSPVSLSPVWVSDLALVLRKHPHESEQHGLVLDAATGEPVAGALVQAWALASKPPEHNRAGLDADPDKPDILEQIAPATTDTDGIFRLPLLPERSHLLLASHGEDRVAFKTELYGRMAWPEAVLPREPKPARQVRFFTDRAIYRPGQTLRFKGILFESDPANDRYSTLAGEDVTILLRDGYRNERARLVCRSNDYGSFSGSFTIPFAIVTGSLWLTGEGMRDTAHLRVEEYKRPTFQVALTPPETAVKLNEFVRLTGTATAYTGAPTDGADVRWRVERMVGYRPSWWHRHWRKAEGQQSPREIASGTTRTDSHGAFSIKFIAWPDPKAFWDGEPVFHYSVTADVTDAAGETRSARRTVVAGAKALRAHLSADNWLEANRPFDLALRTVSIDGKGQSAQGRLIIYRLASPERPHRAALAVLQNEFARFGHYGFDRSNGFPPSLDMSDPDNWPLGEKVGDLPFQTDAEGLSTQSVTLETGLYRAVLETSDRFGQPVRAKRTLRVLDPDAERLTLKIPHLFDAPRWTVEPGETFVAYWGSGYERARALIEIEHRGTILQRYWSEPGRTQIPVRLNVMEAMRGGFHVHVTHVAENRAYLETKRVDVPWTSKNLTVSWERFTSRLEPGAKEVWTAVVSGPDAQTAAAEMVATLYDRSLDAFAPHRWQDSFGRWVFRHDVPLLRSRFQNHALLFRSAKGNWPSIRPLRIRHREFRTELLWNYWNHPLDRIDNPTQVYLFGRPPALRPPPDDPDPDADARDDALEALVFARDKILWDLRRLLSPTLGDRATPPTVEERLDIALQHITPVPAIDLEHVQARRDFSETAFFFPHLVSGKDGKVRMEFTMPEALTEWAFMGFAHDRELRAGLLTGSMVTAKELMVQPNPPRFLREGDRIEFVVRVTNRSAARQTGAVRLTFSDARTGDSLDKALGLIRTEQPFDVPAGESRTYAWPLTVPNRPGILVYRAVASTGRLSDGEENWLPVLSRRALATESLPLPLRGAGEKRFEFGTLLRAAESDTLDSQTLTLQMVSQPAWYAVMALPWLMERPHQSSDQIFHRLYANSLARHIANADPKIRRVFDLWKNTDALDSPLEKNKALKAVALEETPWVREAESESQARRRVGILFDANRLDDETARAFHELSEAQLTVGAWPWFPNGRPDPHLTMRIVAGFGRLRHLGAQADPSAALRAIPWLDNWMDERYRRIVEDERLADPNLSPTLALYLYARSFFLKDLPLPADRREAHGYFLGQAREHWLTLGHRQSQAHLALALHRHGEREAAGAILRSLRERAVTDNELGMYWRDSERSWWWYRAPIETQAMMIEAFDEVAGDAEAVEACQTWLLKQKQTRHWRASRATADAVYALLMRGADRLASDALVEVELGGRKIVPDKTEAGTGFFEKRFVGPEIAPELGRIALRKRDDGVAWGSLHWQYLEDIAKVAPHDGTPLRLERALYVNRDTPRGPELQPVNGPLAVGDELVSRIVLRTDRDMEYVHLKDERGSGTEPTRVLSGHRYRDGLSYYETVRDTATHFFIGYLPKGTYVFETSVRVQHRGRYPSGLARVQCLYAPEFNSHAASADLAVE